MVAVLAAGLALGAPGASATFPGANGLIAFASDRSGDYEVYTMTADGTGLQRLTNAPGSDGPGTWSPDGSKLLFSSERDGNSEIYVMNADGSGQTRLTNNAAQDNVPSFSPDGTKIAFSSNRDGNLVGEVYVMNADGSDQTRITHTTSAIGPGGEQAGVSFHPNWSADNRIAYGSTGTSNTGMLQVWLMAPDGSGQTQVTNDPSGAFLPTWSPDSTRLVFYSARDGAGEIYAINPDGSGETRLTNSPAEDALAAFSPDGTKIAFNSARDGNNELYLMNPDGSGQTRLTTDPSNEVGASWQSAPKLDPPKIGETVNVSVVSGTVLLRARGGSGFSTLAQARQIKVGSQLDTTKGVVRMASAADNKGHTQTGDFGRGVFQVAQSKSAKGLTDLKLMGGKFGSCGATGKKGSVAASKKKTIRSLFSKAKGKFRTKGRYSSATVRGTSWLVSDRCDGTLTTVKSGTVSVFDFKRKKTVKVKAGKSYLARAKR
jgi:Tol biopolymer transport system component